MIATPWWRALRLRDEVSRNAGNIDDVQMSLYRAVYGDPPPPYSDPHYYGAITYPTATLAALMGRIAVRLWGGERYTAVKALYHLDQGMGGGKSHGLIGLYHLANSPEVVSTTDIGRLALEYATGLLGGSPLHLEPTQVVVISADHMTPLAPDDRPEMDGPARSLWERLLWRLVRRDYQTYVRYKDRWDQDGIREALRSVGRPVLILVDEIMDYVRQLDDTRYDGVRNAELAFLKALFDAVNDVPHVAMVLVMIATDKDRMVYDKEALRFREELQGNLVRNGSSTAVTEASDFSQIIRRRLFEGPAPEDIVAATATLYTEVPAQWATVLRRITGYDPVLLAQGVARSYPFHPDLLHLVEAEWATLAGYQRVRSTVTLFAQTVYTWMCAAEAGGWAPLLIGPGDIPLEKSAVREALLSSGVIESETTIANYRQVVTNDIVSEGGGGGAAASLDREFAASESWAEVNPYAARRMATALLLYSLAPRSGGKLGATEAEIRAAAFVPDPAFAATDAETAFTMLSDTEKGLGTLEKMAGPGGQDRYRLTTRQTLQMLFRQQRSAVSDGDKDELIAELAEKMMNIGGSGFSKKPVFIRNELNAQGLERSPEELLGHLDERDETRLVVLDSSRWTLLNGVDDNTRQTIRMVFGLPPRPLPVTHAASLVIACANTQRRNVARNRAGEYLAWNRVLNIPTVQDDSGLKREAQSRVEEARKALEKEIKRAFQHFTYLVRDINNQLEVRFAKFDDDTRTALVGAHVWDELEAAGRAVRPGGLTVEGLMLNIKDELPRPLAEVKDLFWANPRMPLLAGVDELRKALIEALKQRRLELVNDDGERQPVPDRASNLPIGSWSIRVRLPQEEAGTAGDAAPVGQAGLWPEETGAGGRTDPTPAGSSGRPPDGSARRSEPIVRTQLTLKTRVALSNQGQREALVGLLKRLISLTTSSSDEEVESLILSLEIIGDKPLLAEAANIAKQIEGTQPRFDDLPS